MIYTTAEDYTLSFVKVDSAERFDKPALITAGFGDKPDYGQMQITDLARANEWRARILEVVATSQRIKPPYIPPPDETPTAAPAPVAATTEEKGAAEVYDIGAQ